MNQDNLNPLSELTDREILELISNREDFEKGFRSLVVQYQEKVYWHIRRMVENHEDTNDIIQNTFIKVYKNINRFEGKSRLYTWIYRIATNETISFLNREKKHASYSIGEGEGELELKQDRSLNMSGAEIQVLLEDAIATLPEKQRTVFNMRYYEERSYADMSRLLDTSVGALKASYHHAVKKIEALIIKKGMDRI